MKNKPFRILQLEDDPSTIRLVHDLLRQVALDCHILVVESIVAYKAAIQYQPFDLVLADCQIARADEWQTLELAQRTAEKTPYILIADSISEEHAIDGLQRGAWDYVLKSNLRNLPYAILRARDYFREKTLQRTEEKAQWYADLLDLSNDAIFVRDAFDIIIYWNKGAERLYGWLAAEAIGKRARHVLRSSSPQMDWEALANECRETGHWEGELVRYRRDGEVLTVSSRWTARSHPNPAHAEIVEIDSDCTPIKRVEEQFHQAQKAQGLGALAGGMAHNLNNVLAAFQSALGILKLSGRRPDEMSMIYEILETSVERGTTLVRQIAMLAKTGTSSLSDVNINDQVREIVFTIQQTFPKTIQAKFECEENLPAIRGDSDKINQMLLNLCLNSRESFPTTGGTITLSTKSIEAKDLPHQMDGIKATEYVCISVEDTGRGMSEQMLAKTMEPFFTPRMAEPGSGLGLQAVYGIVREHEGFVSIRSKLGFGTKVTIYFPATPRAAAICTRQGRLNILPSAVN